MFSRRFKYISYSYKLPLNINKYAIRPISIAFPSGDDAYIKKENYFAKYSSSVAGFSGGFNMGPNDPKDPKDPKKPNVLIVYYKKFKMFMKQYGWVGLGTYWCIWSGTFASFYCVFESGLVDYHTWQFLHLDLLESYYVKYMPMIGLDVDVYPINSKTESLLVAFMASKITKPIQWCVVLGITPIISQKLGYAPIPDVSMTQKIKNVSSDIKDKINEKMNQ